MAQFPFEFLELMDRDALDVVQPDVSLPDRGAGPRGDACARPAIVVVPHAEIGHRHRRLGPPAAIAPTCTYIEFLPLPLSDSRLRRELVPDELPVVDGVNPAADQARPRHHGQRRSAQGLQGR